MVRVNELLEAFFNLFTLGFGSILLVGDFIASDNVFAWIESPGSPAVRSFFICSVCFHTLYLHYMITNPKSGGICKGVVATHCSVIFCLLVCALTGQDATIVLVTMILSEFANLPLALATLEGLRAAGIPWYRTVALLRPTSSPFAAPAGSTRPRATAGKLASGLEPLVEGNEATGADAAADSGAGADAGVDAGANAEAGLRSDHGSRSDRYSSAGAGGRSDGTRSDGRTAHCGSNSSSSLPRDGRLAARVRRQQHLLRRMTEGIVSASDSDGTGLDSGGGSGGAIGRQRRRRAGVAAGGDVASVCTLIVSRLLIVYFTAHIVLPFAALDATRFGHVCYILVCLAGLIEACQLRDAPRALSFFRMY
jgi:hypothetical protein